MTNSITTTALIMTLSAAIKRAWRLIRTGERWADKVEYSTVYSKPVWMLCKCIEAVGLALEAWADRTAKRLGVLDDVLDRCAG